MESSRGPIDPSPKPFRGPWEGETKIVVGIDIGTTQSGVAFTFLQQGASQIIHRITQWPGQEAHNKQGKIPTVIWYDSNKQAVLFGAEATSHQGEADAEDNGWQIAKYFKLHLHPNDMQAKHDLKLEPLPVGVTLRQIYKDFLGYLLQQTQSYFESRILSGKDVWETYKSTMEVVIAHPNGWGIREQTFLRSAAVEAGFASIASAPTKVRFVTEAEASVHFCIYHTNLGNRLQPGSNFAVCDAGGSTVDTTLYSVSSARPVLKLKEVRASACVQAGAIFIDGEMERYLEKTLVNTQLSAEEVGDYTKAGVKDFENFAKRAFNDTSTDYSITIAHSRFNNSAIRTRRGRMALSGSTIESFFSVCLDEITQSVDQQIGGSSVPYILLVGGFGDSPFLRESFKSRYGPKGTHVTLTNDSTSKAVADGAVIWNAVNSVFSRAPRYSFGTACSNTFDPFSYEHQGRRTFVGADGITKVGGIWGLVVSKGVSLDESAVCRKSYSRQYKSSTPDLERFEVDVISHSDDGNPKWAYNKQYQMMPGFRKACTVHADLSNLSGALTCSIGVHGRPYWRLSFDVCIKFGGTEWQAFLEWKENGVTRTGPVTIIPEDVVVL